MSTYRGHVSENTMKKGESCNKIISKLHKFIRKKEKHWHIPPWTWRWRYQWNTMVAIVVVLVIYNAVGNMWVLRQPYDLLQHLSTLNSLTFRCLGSTPSVPDDEPLARLDLRLGRWDVSRSFKTFDNAAVGHLYLEFSATRFVCLATQSSVHNLQGILKTAAHWSGPISLAVIAAGDEMRFLQAFVTWLLRCQPEIYSRLVIHVATSAERPPVLGTMPSWARDCNTQPWLLEEKIMRNQTWKKKYPYPQNLLRNLARKNCHTPYVYMVDVDIVPSKGMAESLDEFLSTSQECKLCAYVIPTYELDWSVSNFPANKSELLRLVKKGLAVQFHKKTFIYNQLSSNLDKWEASRGIEKNETHISHNVTSFKLLYEPFYVAPDSVPPHDERFLGYGFTRSTQVYEMFLLDYQFKVLSPIFTIHWGIKKSKPLWRVRQVRKNSKRFRSFKKELYVKYRKDPLGLFNNKFEQEITKHETPTAKCN